MIDRIPETTTLKCTLPKASADQLKSLARERHLRVSDLVRQTLLRFLRDAEVGSIDNLVSTGAQDVLLPDPPIPDGSIVAPCDLPLSSSREIATQKVSEMLPEPLVEE